MRYRRNSEKASKVFCRFRSPLCSAAAPHAGELQSRAARGVVPSACQYEWHEGVNTG